MYLICGERYLCRDVADKLVQHLLPDEKERSLNLKRIDGEQEDVAHTMAHLQTYSLFAGRQVIRVMDSKLFFSKAVAKNFWDKAKKAAGEGNPEKAGRFLQKMINIGGLDAEESLTDLTPAQWKKLFSFAKPADTGWCADISLPQQEKGSDQETQGADLVLSVLEKGIPKSNVLILVAEAADKRKKIYKKIEKLGAVIDLSVDSGATSAAKKGQDAVIRELIVRTFSEMGKKPGPRVIDCLIDRVGFHPVAAVREAEKLALFAGEADVINLKDLDAIIGQTREEAIYELNDAVAGADLSRSLELLASLQESGLHSLALVASLRNVLRKLLFFRALRESEQPSYSPGLSYGAFQKGYLPQLKKSEQGQSPFLGSHPFVLYKTFQQTDNFDISTLQNALRQLLDAEFQLKGSGIPDKLVLENFLFSFLLRDSKSLSR
ncbi:MAG: DNA polymerase III subunit delta [Desulfobulbaceae bacterium]|nr:DNA polymerase III subunit delta [Desulfobulbaceae bacterium]